MKRVVEVCRNNKITYEIEEKKFLGKYKTIQSLCISIGRINYDIFCMKLHYDWVAFNELEQAKEIIKPFYYEYKGMEILKAYYNYDSIKSHFGFKTLYDKNCIVYVVHLVNDFLYDIDLENLKKQIDNLRKNNNYRKEIK